MSRILYVHIGAENTGSSSIQDCLQRQQWTNGVYLQYSRQGDHRSLPAMFMDVQKDDDLFLHRGLLQREERERWQRTMRQHVARDITSLDDKIRFIVMSSEQFHSRMTTDDEVRRVIDFFSAHVSSIRIICYVRNQYEQCLSHYSTLIRAGLDVDLEDVLKACRPENLYYNHHQMLLLWSRVVGKENVIVRPFLTEHWWKGDLGADFCHIISPQSPFSSRNIRKNVSLDVRGIRWARRVNRMLSVPHTRRNESLREPLRAILVNHIIGKMFRGSLDEEVGRRKEIMKRFEESNLLLANDFLGVML